MAHKDLSSVIYVFMGFVLVGLIYYSLQASFLASQGQQELSAQTGFAVNVFSFFLFGTALTFLAITYGIVDAPKTFSGDRSLLAQGRDFSLGFIVFSLINVGSQYIPAFQFSVLSTGKSIFAQTSQALGLESFQGLFMNAVAAPITEELAFFIAIPIIIIVGLNKLAEATGIKYLANPFVQAGIYIPVVSFMFAGFHIGNATLTGFFISAMVFRGILLTLGTDTRVNIVDGVFAGLLFAISGHMANNIAQTGGLVNFASIMISATTPIEILLGYGIMVLMGLMFISGGIWFYKWVTE